jgi:hypothetical protein
MAGQERGAARGPRRGGSRGHEDQVEADLTLDLVEFDLREDRLVVEPDRVVAATVKGLGRDSAEVADVWSREIDEAVEELPHARATEGHARSEGFTLTELEVGDGLLRVADGSLLAGDLADFGHGVIDGQLAIGGLAHAGGHHDLFEAWDLMDVLVAQLLGESGDHFFFVVLEERWSAHGGLRVSAVETRA